LPCQGASPRLGSGTLAQGAATAESFEIAAHGTTAVLAIWLGLTVITRARRVPAANVFGTLCALLVAWSAAILVQRLTTDPGVADTFNRVEDAAGSLVPAVTLHVAGVFSGEGPRRAGRTATIVLAYLISILMASIALLAPDQAWALTPPNFSWGSIDGSVFGWIWVVTRLAMLALAAAWIAAPLRITSVDRARRQQLYAALATVLLGSAGGALRIVSQAAPSEPWIGVLLIDMALVIAAYAVFAQGVFLAPAIAGRAFLYSLVIGLGIVAVTVAVVGLDSLVRHSLGLEVPFVAALSLVAVIALFDPVADRVRHLVGRAEYSGIAERLQRALDDDLLMAQTPDRAIEPALARLVRTFRLRGALLTDAEGAPLAQVGTDPSADAGSLRVPLRATGQTSTAGTAVFGPKRTHLPFTAQEMTLLSDGALFLADLLDLGHDQDRQADALSDLSRRKAGVERRGEDLSRALGAAAQGRVTTGFRVYALGPLRVERDGVPLSRWGGEKAGSRQAEAIFAFLFDRGERGVAKDEILELIWPDVDLERADLAFHRTLGGLRTVLEPSRRARDRGDAITFHHDRYRLDPGLVAGSDVADLEAELLAASQATDVTDRVTHLERARALYRGDYLDDCPFYGDSSAVEDQRELLRGRWIDVLLSLGEVYEAGGDRPAAAAAFRQARQAAGEPLPSADAALSRLGSPI